MARVLIVDDDKLICEALSHKFSEMGHFTQSALSLADGIAEASAGRYDVIFLDVFFSDGNGISAIPVIRDAPSAPEIIIMTGEAKLEGAEIAINSGVWDYIEKPVSMSALTLSLDRALQYRALKTAAITPHIKRDGIVGESTVMRRCIEQVGLAAASDVGVLITGETGTGKELLARAIHANSRRAAGAFMAVDCASLTMNLAESTLFGCDKGAYTGADKAREGLIKLADGGTLFLDEVVEIPLTVQKIFLRVLQERSFRPLGCTHEVLSDFRVIAATNRDIDKLAAEGAFRHDLLYRLKGIAIEAPPLRDRGEDIGHIALHYIASICVRHGYPPKTPAPGFIEDLMRYRWPGNVRELIHAMDRACAAAGGEPMLFTRHLPEHIRVGIAQAGLKKARSAQPVPPKRRKEDKIPTLQEMRVATMEHAEREYLEQVLSLSGGDVTQAMRLAGLSRSRFYELLHKHGLAPDT